MQPFSGIVNSLRTNLVPLRHVYINYYIVRQSALQKGTSLLLATPSGLGAWSIWQPIFRVIKLDLDSGQYAKKFLFVVTSDM